MKKVGLHIRIQNNVMEVIEKAIRLELPFFQNFLLAQATGRYVKVSPDEKREFLKKRRDHFDEMFVHGSYWINGASPNAHQRRLLLRELKLASDLEFTHYVLHPGSARGCAYRENGIDNLVRLLNHIVQNFPRITIVLENTAHGNMTVGSDLNDFIAILEKVDHPEALAFCIDTAHAHAYGYDLREGHQQEFLKALDRIGFERIALLHLNDACEKSGSKIDRHERVGAGCIGEASLKALINCNELRHVPLLLEPPELSDDEEIEEVEKVKTWII